MLVDEVSILLDSLDLNYLRAEHAIHLRWQTEHFEDLRIKIVSNESETWLYVIASFSNFDDVDEKFRYAFSLEMLQASWLYNGIKFALSPENDVIVVAQTNDTDLTKEELKVLVDNVVNGAEILWQISDKLGKESTSEHNTDPQNSNVQ